MAVAPHVPIGDRRVVSFRRAESLGQVLAAWLDTLFGPGAPRLAEWISTGAARLVKHGAHRDVYAVEAEGRHFFVKCYRAGSWGKRLANFWRGSPARREWQNARELTRRGVATVEPLAWADRMVGGMPGESFFISAAIPSSRTAEAWLAEMKTDNERMSVRSRRQSIRALARFVAQAHEAGVAHDDFHLGNILIREVDAPASAYTEESFHLIDVPGARLHRGALAWSTSRQALVVLMAGVLERTTPTDWWSFWREYHRQRPSLAIDLRVGATEIASRAQPYLRRVFRSRDRRALADNRDFRRHRVGDCVGHAIHAIGPEEFGALAREANRRSGASAVERDCKEFSFDGRLLRCVQYAGRGLFGRGEHARRLWSMGQALWSRGIAVRRPLCLVQQTAPGAPAAYLLFDARPHTISLGDILRQGTAETEDWRSGSRNALPRAMGQLVGQLHRWGFSLGAPEVDWFGVAREEGQAGPIVEHYERLRIRQSISAAGATRELRRVSDSASQAGLVSQTQRLRFLRGYLIETGVSPRAWKAWWRIIDAIHR